MPILRYLIQHLVTTLIYYHVLCSARCKSLMELIHNLECVPTLRIMYILYLAIEMGVKHVLST